MKTILPNREAAERKGWTYQVQWIEDEKPCFIRCKSKDSAEICADALRRNGQKPEIIVTRT